jgi:hypothetical protein
VTDQQITQTMRFRGGHDNDRLALGPRELYRSFTRQNLLEVRNHPIRRRRPFEGRAHKKMLGF